MGVERWRVSEEESGIKLPEVLCRHVSLHLPSRKQARRLIESGCCSVNGKIRKFASTVVREGDLIEIVPGQRSQQRPECTILYEDEWLFVINKPPGLTVEKENMEHALKKDCFLVHRLDKETSGLLLIAKDSNTASSLELLFRKRALLKEYLAIVDGEVERKHGTIEASLTRKAHSSGKVFWGVTHEPTGKRAYTEFTRVMAKKDASFVYLVPRTGRTHQLRVHMAHLGHPILGDYQYADHFHSTFRPSRLLLHAWKLSLCHPLLGQEMSWTAPLPDDMRGAVKMLFHIDVERKLCVL